MKYYVVLTLLEVPLVEPLPGETKAANVVNVGCDLCLFDIVTAKPKLCKDHYKKRDLVLVYRKVDLPTEADNVGEIEVQAEATIPVVQEAVPELEAVPA